MLRNTFYAKARLRERIRHQHSRYVQNPYYTHEGGITIGDAYVHLY